MGAVAIARPFFPTALPRKGADSAGANRPVLLAGVHGIIIATVVAHAVIRIARVIGVASIIGVAGAAALIAAIAAIGSIIAVVVIVAAGKRAGTGAGAVIIIHIIVAVGILVRTSGSVARVIVRVTRIIRVIVHVKLIVHKFIELYIRVAIECIGEGGKQIARDGVRPGGVIRIRIDANQAARFEIALLAGALHKVLRHVLHVLAVVSVAVDEVVAVRVVAPTDQPRGQSG